MRVPSLHRWNLSPAAARLLQERLRSRVEERRLDWKSLHRVAGCDVAIDGDTLIAAVVVIDRDSREVIERVDAGSPLRFPYVPGLLSFREIPALLRAFRRLREAPDAVMVDGQGRAHPRRFGLACHLGVLLDRPTVGVAKSRLIGSSDEPDTRRGSWTALLDGEEMIGGVLRTRDRVRPLYVSVGHRITLIDSLALVLAMGGGYRLPEPTRLADQHVRGLARRNAAGPATIPGEKRVRRGSMR